VQDRGGVYDCVDCEEVVDRWGGLVLGIEVEMEAVGMTLMFVAVYGVVGIFGVFEGMADHCSV